MARAQSQFLRIYDAAGVSYIRWQNYYFGQQVSWSGSNWQYQDFVAEGIMSGHTGDESGITVAIPATSIAVDVVNLAVRQFRLLELSVYQFDTLLGNTAPQAGQELIGQFNGEIIGAAGSFVELRVEVGSNLSPTGAQFPPRTLTTGLIGKGATL